MTVHFNAVKLITFYLIFTLCYEHGRTQIVNNTGTSKEIESISIYPNKKQFYEFFALLDDHYIYIYRNAPSVHISIMNKEGKEIKTVKSEGPENIKSIQFHGAFEVNGQATIFFTGTGGGADKGHTGLFAWTYDIDLLDFKEPKLVDQFEGKKTDFTKVEILESQNKKYRAFILAPGTLCSSYSHNILVTDADLKILYSKKNEEGDHESCIYYQNAYLSNNGDVYMIFMKNEGKYEMTSFQMKGELGSILKYSKDDALKKMSVHNSDRVILKLKFYEEENELVLFYAWYNEETNEKCGFSIIDPENMQETKIHDFDPAQLEPYIEVSGASKYADASQRENLLSKTKVNVYIDLVGTVQVENDLYFILQKNTPVRYKSSSYVYSNIQGDILIVNLEGKLIKKIERMVATPYTPRGIKVVKNEKTISLFYYSIPPDEIHKKTGSRANMRYLSDSYFPPDLNFYHSVFTPDNNEVFTEEIILGDEEDYYIWLSPSRIIETPEGLISQGYSNKRNYAINLSDTN